MTQNCSSVQSCSIYRIRCHSKSRKSLQHLLQNLCEITKKWEKAIISLKSVGTIAIHSLFPNMGFMTKNRVG